MQFPLQSRFAMNDSDKKSEIRNLLFVFGSAIGLAALAAGYIIYSSSIAGQHKLDYILISPEVIATLNSAKQSNKAINLPPVLFKKIELSFFNPDRKQWEKKEISQEKYQTLFNQIAADRSLEPPPEAALNAFHQPPPIKMAILVEEKMPKNIYPVKSIFQEVDFSAAGDFYRVQLREQKQESQQAYFYHSNIYETVLNLFNSLP